MSCKRIERGCLYEDFEEGRIFEHHWGRTFTAHDAIWYSSITMQYNPLYCNDVYARRLGYNGIPINPLFVFTTALGLSVEDLSEAGGPFLGVDDVKFHQAVYPGDTINSRSIVLSRRISASRAGWGIVEWKTTAVNQRDVIVLEFRRRNLARLRAAPKQIAKA
jgi:itaconyl-CoA hydratase